VQLQIIIDELKCATKELSQQEAEYAESRWSMQRAGRACWRLMLGWKNFWRIFGGFLRRNWIQDEDE
jgi:hypothetical protein